MLLRHPQPYGEAQLGGTRVRTMEGCSWQSNGHLGSHEPTTLSRD
jgi:hypothetical protein